MFEARPYVVDAVMSGLGAHLLDVRLTERNVAEGQLVYLSDIEVDSVPGHYTEFKITLPRPWDGEEHEDYEDSPDDEELELQQAHVK